MKHIRTFESYRTLRKEEVELVNEEIFGAIGKFFSNLFKNIKEKIKKVKGGNEVEAIYTKYIKQINDQFTKQAGVDLNISAGEVLDDKAKAKKEADAKAKPAAAGAPVAQKERFSYLTGERINEEAEPTADSKMKIETLKKKKAILDQIVAKLKQMALKEMDTVLKKMGGAAENPQLEIVISAKKDQFDLDYMNAQIAYLEKAGDTTQVPAIAKQRDAISKKIEGQFANIDKVKSIKYEKGDQVIYLKKDKKKEDYDSKKKPEEQKDIVGIGTLILKDKDKTKIEDEDGKEIDLSSDAIVGKPEASKGIEFKEGDTVVFRRDGFKENEGKKKWSELKDEDKQNEESDGLKKMLDDELVNIKKVERIEGEFFVFKGKDDKEFKKKKSEVLGLIKAKEGQAEEEKKEGQAEEEKK